MQLTLKQQSDSSFLSA